MAGSSGDRPARTGAFVAILAGMPPGTVGWVFQGYEDENLAARLRPGRVDLWGDARSRGKVPGQPVLYLQADRRSPHWVGWGRIVPPEERWLVFGVPVRCEGIIPEGLPVFAPATTTPGQGADGDTGARHEWEYRELGHALGLGGHRERTPFLDNGARDLRVSAHDLAHLLRLQPGLAELGRSPRGSE